MTSDIVREGKAAWSRVKQGGGTWEDWKAVGYALLEGRAIAARYARPRRVGGHGYWPAFNGWLSDNRLNMPPTDAPGCSGLWRCCRPLKQRETLPPIRRLRMNCPSAVLKNYCKETGIKSAPECLRSPPSPP